MLSMYISNKQNDWDEWIPFVAFAYNSTIQESLNESPHFLLYRQDPKLPVDIALGFSSDADPVSSTSQYKEDLVQKLVDARKIARAHLSKNQQRQKTRYDSKRKSPDFELNDLVWLRSEKKVKGKSKKLSMAWDGPFRIVEIPSELTRKIKATANPKNV